VDRPDLAEIVEYVVGSSLSLTFFMPKRTDQQVVSDMALSRVRNVFSDCGWASEVVHNDYGEDLLVQTSYYGLMDSFKIWVQVKGTNDLEQFQTKKYGYSIRVSLEHAFKWARSQDLVAVILWDVNTNRSLWGIPKDDLDEWSWRNFDSKSVRLRFRQGAPFDIAAAQKLCCEARIAHYNNRFLAQKAGMYHTFAGTREALANQNTTVGFHWSRTIF
jgi:hypothetical protein